MDSRFRGNDKKGGNDKDDIYSDRRRQYASIDYLGLLKEYGIIPSMSRKGNKIGNIMMRLDDLEKKALRFAIKGFKGKVFLFGSRSNDKKRGGDIDIMLYPKQQNTNPVKLSLDVQARFFSICEQKLDVIIYKKDNIFCKEILKNAKPLNIKTI